MPPLVTDVRTEPVRPTARRRGSFPGRPRSRATAAAALVAVVAAAALAVVVVVLTGSAGTPGGAYRSTVVAVEPAVDGVHVEVDPATGGVTLSRDGDRTVVVLGYDDEEFLRLGPDGVERNASSVTAALVDGTDLRTLAGRAATARWTTVSSDDTTSWPDLRTRWTGTTAPPNVAADPDRPHRVSTWAIPLMVDGSPVLVRGAVEWTGPARRWPWAVAGLVALAVLVGAGAAGARPLLRRYVR